MPTWITSSLHPLVSGVPWNGMAGSMYQSPNGTWVLRVHTGRDPLTGKKQYRARSFRGTQRDAGRALAAFVTELDGTRPGPADKTFGELLEKWYLARSSDWSPSTAQQTRWMIDRRLEGLHGRKVADLGTEDLDIFYGALRQRGGQGGRPLSVASVARVHTVVRLALSQAVSWGWRSENPADRADPGKHDQAEIRPPSPNAVKAIFEAAVAKDLDLLTFVALEAETGARRGELAALRFRDFQSDAVTIGRSLVIGPDSSENRERYEGHSWPASWSRGDQPTLLIEKLKPKNRRSVRTIALSAASSALVAQLRLESAQRALVAGFSLDDDAFLFAAEPDGSRPLRPETWTRRFNRLRDGLGLESVRLHDLRHFVATTLLASGTDLATVAGRLGHGSGGKTTLAVYGHFLQGAPPDRAAAEMLAGLLRRIEPEVSPKSPAVVTQLPAM